VVHQFTVGGEVAALLSAFEGCTLRRMPCGFGVGCVGAQRLARKNEAGSGGSAGCRSAFPGAAARAEVACDLRDLTDKERAKFTQRKSGFAGVC